MQAAQHLAEREIECAETGLAGGGFVIVAIPLVCSMCGMRGLIMGFQRVPRGMHQRALLRGQQQEDQKIM